jgi:transposase
MPKVSQRPKLILSTQDLKELKKISQSLRLPKRKVQRAHILLLYYEGNSIKTICEKCHVVHQTVYKWIDRAHSMGWRDGLKDSYHSPKAPSIDKEDKAWAIHVACTSPKQLGLAAEIWSYSLLTEYVRKHAEICGHPSLARIAKSTIHRILKEHHLQPHKVKYYLEKRDPEFEEKMREVLLVYKEVELWHQADKEDKRKNKTITVSIDEKPGVQALANTSPDLPPVPDKHNCMSRDHEYVRHGTASILACLDLHDGHIIAQVHRRHRSREFIELLKEIDSYYPKDVQIRVILDNHSAHISQETKNYLATRPGRFVYVHTPKHGSWLNIVETLFGKMSRTFLRHIRVASWEELKERILMGIKEINQSPVVHRWKTFNFLKKK